MGSRWQTERQRKPSLLAVLGPIVFWIMVMVGLALLRANNGR